MVEVTQFRNPWYNKRNPDSRQWYRITYNCKAEEYKGYYIIRNVNPWVDVVDFKDEEYVCVTQRGSVRNAKQFIDNLCDK